MEHTELKELLEALYDRYNVIDFISEDPISIPHSFERKEDIEISGFLAATIAWGNRKSIVNNAFRLMERLDNAPYDFTMNASEQELNTFCGCIHRTFNGSDCADFIRGIRHVCTGHGSLGAYFEQAYADSKDLRVVLSRFGRLFREADHNPRSEKHLSSIDKGAACKRLNMYLKWMIRNDERGVDFGLWQTIPASALYLPLDVHTGNVGRALKLLSRKQNDWKAVEEITATLRTLDPNDPVKYDFALFGAGIEGKFHP